MSSKKEIPSNDQPDKSDVTKTWKNESLPFTFVTQAFSSTSCIQKGVDSMLCNKFILVVSRRKAVMASGLVDWVAKVFSSRGLQVILQYTGKTFRSQQIVVNNKISGWGACPLGMRGGLDAGGVWEGVVESVHFGISDL